MDFLDPRKAYRRAQTDDDVESEASTPGIQRPPLTWSNTISGRPWDDDTGLKPQPSITELQSHHSNGSFQSDFSNTFRSGFSNSIQGQSPLLAGEKEPVRVEPVFVRRSFFETLKAPFVWWPKTLYGWRAGALTAAMFAAISLLINFGVLIWLISRGGGGSLVELYNGDCGEVEKIDIWVHLGINVLSTLLLGGSNYCMQCLSAPTRRDVDRAHSKHRYLDIGIPSIRNLRSIPTHKITLWFALGLSSVPLHLMYNSSFYKSLATNDYDYYFVTQDFINGLPVTFNASSYSPYGVNIVDPKVVQSSLRNTPSIWQRLEVADCIQAYGTNFQSDRRQLLLVTNNATTSTNDSVLSMLSYSFQDYRTFDWLCSADGDMANKVNAPVDGSGYPAPCAAWIERVVAAADQWMPYTYSIQYCLSETLPERCSYSGNIPIISVVVVSNLMKIVIMLYVGFRLRDNPLITIGDALETFLSENEDTTDGQCLLSKQQVIISLKSRKTWAIQRQDREPGQIKGTLASRRRKRWATAASMTRWIVTIGLITLALSVVAGLLGIAVHAVHGNGLTIQKIGLGRVTPAAIISSGAVGAGDSASQKILSSILVANVPQMILSFVYLNLNSLLTSMWLSQEWSNFAKERKYLRVSNPKGDQRSTHFLQLPYKVAIPLMVISGLLHWLVSQSIYLAVVAAYGPDGVLETSVAIASCGFSPLAMILVLMTGGLIIIVTFALGWFRKYDMLMPLVGSCSAAIAAACHQPEWDSDASMKPVQWGALPTEETMDSKGQIIGHCTFSSGEVESVVEGREYAGTVKGENLRQRRVQ